MNVPSMTSPADRRSRLDRRSWLDRREKPTSFWGALRFGGRRRGFRRDGEGQRGTVDCPMPSVIALVVWVTVCSALDAFFTLLYITNGGREANPVMAFALTYGNVTFVILKMGVTCIGVWLLGVFQHFPMAYTFLKGLVLMYLVIMGLHTMLLFS